MSVSETDLPPESSSEEQKLVVSSSLLCWVDELSPPPVGSTPLLSAGQWAWPFRRSPVETTANQQMAGNACHCLIGVQVTPLSLSASYLAHPHLSSAASLKQQV